MFFPNNLILGISTNNIPIKVIHKKIQKRCPNGTRRNKKTGECESSLITIKNATPKENRLIAETVSQNIVNKKDNIMSTVPKIQKTLKSFSPSINKKLVSIKKNTENLDIFGCGIENFLLPKNVNKHIRWDDEGNMIPQEKASLKIKVGTKKKWRTYMC